MENTSIGNATILGFVNDVKANRVLVGTGSYQTRDGQKVFKESVSVFVDDKFDGQVPVKGDYVKVTGDLRLAENKQRPGTISVSMNVRFKDQLTQAEKPQAKQKDDGGAQRNDDI